MNDDPAYEAESAGIRVRVRPSYLAGQSDPDAGRWVWAYQVEIVGRIEIGNLTLKPLFGAYLSQIGTGSFNVTVKGFITKGAA